MECIDIVGYRDEKICTRWCNASSIVVNGQGLLSNNVKKTWVLDSRHHRGISTYVLLFYWKNSRLVVSAFSINHEIQIQNNNNVAFPHN